MEVTKKTSLSSEELLKAYKSMFLIREAEQKIADLYLKHKIMSFVHFYVGDRAVPHGSQPGVQLKQISTMIASSSRDWKLATNIQEAPRIEPPPRQGLSVHSRELD